MRPESKPFFIGACKKKTFRQKKQDSGVGVSKGPKQGQNGPKRLRDSPKWPKAARRGCGFRLRRFELMGDGLIPNPFCCPDTQKGFRRYPPSPRGPNCTPPRRRRRSPPQGLVVPVPLGVGVPRGVTLATNGPPRAPAPRRTVPRALWSGWEDGSSQAFPASGPGPPTRTGTPPLPPGFRPLRVQIKKLGRFPEGFRGKCDLGGAGGF